MIDIEDEIQALINYLKTEYKIPAYTYNTHDKFIAGITPVYYSGAFFDDKEIVSAIKSILVGKWMSSGESVREFEKGFSRKINSKFSTMVNSGSSANLLMISALKKFFDWEDGSEIIVSVVGFPTTISVLPQNNLVPVFIDIELETLNFNVNLIEEKITKKTKAIFVSPVLGNPPDMDKIIDICQRYNLQLILDNCDSLGSKWKGKYLTEYAVTSSCSFYAAHEICTFEGGMISSNNGGIINIARSMANWGRGCICSGVENLLPNGVCNHRFDNWIEGYDGIIDHKYLFTNMGYNLKPLELSGAVGIVQLDKLGLICQNRNKSKETICGLFNQYIDEIKIPKQLKHAETVWFGSPIICDTAEQKKSLVRYLESNLIQTRNYFAGNILLHPAYKHLGDYKKFPNANLVLDRVFFVGASPAYNEEVFDYIDDVLKKYKHEEI